MSFFRFLRSLFAKPEPRKVVIADIGEFTDSRYGDWAATVRLDGFEHPLSLAFLTGESPPGETETAFWRRVRAQFPDIWQTVVAGLRRDLQFASPAEADAFFRVLSPSGIGCITASPGQEEWEINLHPEYSEHLLRVSIRGMAYKSYGLDG